MYCPATRQTISEDILNRKHEGLTTMVIDLEDAVGDHLVEMAEDSLLQQIFRLSSFLKIGSLSRDHLPLLFIRIRSAQQLARIIERLEEKISLITGFIFPKFTAANGEAYFSQIAAFNRQQSVGSPVLYGLPILETPAIIYRETRLEELLAIKQLLDRYQRYVLNVRIGATDFSSLFGLRRSKTMTIYDILPVRDCMADIINIFGRMDASYVISGPVWEYFSSSKQASVPSLFPLQPEQLSGKGERWPLRHSAALETDGLLREVMMDKENGIIGKTIIHPSHIRPVQSLYAVTYEEYIDAQSIIASHNGYVGVLKSDYANKMNEVKPHMNWANRVMARSKIYGVLHEEQHFIALLASQEQAYV
ncbi:citrate lyase subunit beta [Paenibacillus sp. Leaf72]|nr:citrate lyase subunit beta [Paenibacillus sp. Leaf72]